MNVNLPTELLRSFVAIVDAGSMSRAADDVAITQSALSLQMKRLADLVQAPIFNRHHRGMLLTSTGKALLGYSRAMLDLNDRAVASISGETLEGPIRIGMIQDFADNLLSDVLLRIMKINPGAALQIKIGNSAELTGQVCAGLLDIALCLAGCDERAAVTTAQMKWLGSANLLLEDRLPIAVIDKPCVFRDAALASLEASGRAYRIILETASISVLRTAVYGGVALTCRTEAFLGGKLEELADLQLPLPRVSYCVHTATNPNPFVDRLAQSMRNALQALPGALSPLVSQAA
jgi:DNA-binding transcriptional LysR family regulator